MTIQNKTILKGYFETGDRPNQSNFVDLIDTFIAQDVSGNVTVSGALTVGTLSGVIRASAGRLEAAPTTGSGSTVVLQTSASMVSPSFNAITLTTTTGIVGTSTNDSAAAGSVGEYISSSVAIGSATSLTTLTSKTVTSISLTAGDWDVWGNVGFVFGATTTCTGLISGIHTVDNTLPTSPNGGGYCEINASFVTGSSATLPTGTTRISVASTTTIYLISRAAFAVSTMAAYGFIGARRVR